MITKIKSKIRFDKLITPIDRFWQVTTDKVNHT